VPFSLSVAKFFATRDDVSEHIRNIAARQLAERLEEREETRRQDEIHERRLSEIRAAAKRASA
jgi:hypothetical protein